VVANKGMGGRVEEGSLRNLSGHTNIELHYVMVKTGNVIPAVEKQNPSQSSLLPGRSKSVKR